MMELKMALENFITMSKGRLTLLELPLLAMISHEGPAGLECRIMVK